MASVCDVCGKGPGFGNNVSHSHVRTRRRWNPNIQTVRALVSGTPKRLNVCTSCIKAGKVTRLGLPSRPASRYAAVARRLVFLPGMRPFAAGNAARADGF